MGSISPQRFYIISVPRSGSNLFVKILGLYQQPNVVSPPGGGYFFMPTATGDEGMSLWGRPTSSWTAEQRTDIMNSFQHDFNGFQAYLDSEAVQGKKIFIKEHSDFIGSPFAGERLIAGGDQNEAAHVNEPWTVQLPHSSTSISGKETGARPQHSILNETIFPDSFLHTFMPTFIIRHPAMAFPSHYRAYLDSYGIEKTKAEQGPLVARCKFTITRKLYDFYAQYFHKSKSGQDNEGKDNTEWPLVLDGDDIMSSQPVMIRYCTLTGLDPDRLQFEWPQARNDDLIKMNPHARRYLSTISTSTSILRSKLAGELDIDVEAAKWREEFGLEEAARVESWVRAAMPDYEYLKARRLRA